MGAAVGVVGAASFTGSDGAVGADGVTGSVFCVIAFWGGVRGTGGGVATFGFGGVGCGLGGVDVGCGVGCCGMIVAVKAVGSIVTGVGGDACDSANNTAKCATRIAPTMAIDLGDSSAAGARGANVKGVEGTVGILTAKANKAKFRTGHLASGQRKTAPLRRGESGVPSVDQRKRHLRKRKKEMHNVETKPIRSSM